ncbi:hypothetical protein FDN13_13960 [Caloramator sp. E03]|nr:hypothetical protein FDN13_13960 [Caloramator sp. E03]
MLQHYIHDDVIDESKLRRGIETLQSKYGKAYAVYLWVIFYFANVL